MKFLTAFLFFFTAMLPGLCAGTSAKQPNLLIIHTDEHNFRTLGCYREQLSDDQAFVWGEGVKVDTPHIDSIAHAGALATSFYAASPVCTPSRASFVTGLYPIATGSPRNDRPMYDEMVTFGEILKRNGYSTAYLGKWHLDGPGKPGWEPTRPFGFEDNRFMFNRGHWKLFEQTEKGAKIIGTYNQKTEKYKYDIEAATAETFATDFLVDRTLEIIDRDKDKDKPFCVMLSLPDPHGPNTVRAPYDTMFDHLHFENPRTMGAALKSSPKWNSVEGRNGVKKLNQSSMADYFGMVKCIDDNVGKILQYLKDNDLEENTIVVFTSDHGDLMGEHAKHNKGTPYETSAGVPFIVRYPKHIRPGKLVHTAFTTADFTPTILGMMDIPADEYSFHGMDESAAFLADEAETSSDRIVYLTNAPSRWVAAVDRRYKLVLSTSDRPWLFDLEKDPDELINFYRDPEYAPVAKRFQAELMRQMKAFAEPALEAGRLKFD